MTVNIDLKKADSPKNYMMRQKGGLAMYLSMLSNEKKHLFLNLEIYMSKIDGEFTNAEKMIIDAHCMEMHIDNNNYEADMSQDEVLRNLQESLTDEERRIVFLELVATVMADDVYHEAEEKLINRFAELLEIDENGVNEAFSIIKDMKAVYERCAKYIK